MKELVCNLHIHSKYSDGTGDYATIAKAALRQGFDVVIVTDHNILVKGVERYFACNGKKVLLLTGEEVHDAGRLPQKNHTLVIGARAGNVFIRKNPQLLMDEIRQPGGLSFPCTSSRIRPPNVPRT